MPTSCRPEGDLLLIAVNWPPKLGFESASIFPQEPRNNLLPLQAPASAESGKIHPVRLYFTRWQRPVGEHFRNRNFHRWLTQRIMQFQVGVNEGWPATAAFAASAWISGVQ